MATCFLASALQGVTPEERKAEFAKPRGLSKSSSSNSSANNSTATPPSAASSAMTDVYKKMGDTFSKEIEDLNKNFTKSLPKIEQETNYLEELNKASKNLESSGELQSQASLLSQYTEVIIATIQDLAQQQIEFELSKINQKTELNRVPSPAETKRDLSHSSSPTEKMTNLSTSRGLFSRELDSLTTKAYNPPN